MTENKDFYFREKMPKAVLREINRSEDIFKASYQSFKNELKWKYDFYAINSNRGMGAILGNLNSNAIVLDYGCGWGNIAKFMSRFVKEVYAMDMTYESLLFCKRTAEKSNIKYIHGGDGDFLPFPENSFDLVFLNGVLEWLPDYKLKGRPDEVQINFLKNVNKILKPGGQIIIGIENRIGWVYFNGIRDEHTGLLFSTLMPRSLADIYSKYKRNRHYRTYTYSYFGYKKLLKKAGFSNCDISIASPNYREISDIANKKFLSSLGSESERETPCSFRSKVKKILVRHIPCYFAHSFLIRADKKTGSMLEKILRDNNDCFLKIDKLHSQNNKSTILVETDDFLYKIPASDRAAANLKQEAEIINKLSQMEKFKKYLPATNWSVLGGTEVQISKRIKKSGNISKEDISCFFELKNERTKIKYRDIFKLQNLEKFLSYNRKENLYASFIEFLGDDEAYCSFAHGDFHTSNILPTENGIKVIDWEFYAPYAPIEFDYINFLLFENAQLNKLNYYSTLKELLNGSIKPASNGISQSFFPIVKAADARVLLLYTIFYNDRLIGRYENVSCVPFEQNKKYNRIIDLAEDFVKSKKIIKKGI